MISYNNNKKKKNRVLKYDDINYKSYYYNKNEIMNGFIFPRGSTRFIFILIGLDGWWRVAPIPDFFSTPSSAESGIPTFPRQNNGIP